MLGSMRLLRGQFARTIGWNRFGSVSLEIRTVGADERGVAVRGADSVEIASKQNFVNQFA